MADAPTETREERRARHRRELQEHADRVYAVVAENTRMREEEARQLRLLDVDPPAGALFVAVPMCDCRAANYDSCICGEDLAAVEDSDDDL